MYIKSRHVYSLTITTSWSDGRRSCTAYW